MGRAHGCSATDIDLNEYYYIFRKPGDIWGKPTLAEVKGSTVVLTTKFKVRGPWSLKVNYFGNDIQNLDGLPYPYHFVTYPWAGN
ncbi:MAG: hypothetical protein OXI29_04080 [bacterium]|nr:hypothetical protein [bacterium]